ncbi:Hypothetical predicted protein [Octopus vulgaris]|uniref:Uncharacterized protein n=1 Tax=Octopus vulgaris TaxID=6645 RepID=A0AA36F880_OCTVU|nr:Hypothetical predicted protein [Octopus vulgaris]
MISAGRRISAKVIAETGDFPRKSTPQRPQHSGHGKAFRKMGAKMHECRLEAHHSVDIKDDFGQFCSLRR